MRDDSVEMTGPAELTADDGDTGMGAEAAHAHLDMREKPDGHHDPLGEAGWYLEHERVSRGMTLDEASEGCGIHPYHLEAIEYGDMTCLPERAEALGMIGAYAQYLGFDPEPLVQHFAQYLPVPALTAEARHPANPGPLSSAKILAFARFAKLPKFGLGRVRGGAGGLVAMIACAILLFGVASHLLMPQGDKAKAPAEAPQKQADALDMSGTKYPEPPPPPAGADPMPTASTGADTADVSVGDGPMPPDETQQATAAPSGQNDLEGTNLDGITALIQKNVPGAAAKSGTAKSGAAKPAAAKPDGMASAAPAPAGDVAMTKDGREFGAANGESRLTLKAKAPVWVRIEDSNGNVVMTQMLMKGDTYRVPNRDGLVVIARDGGLLTYIIDGKEKGILGTPGEILVGRSLDIKSFET